MIHLANGVGHRLASDCTFPERATRTVAFMAGAGSVYITGNFRGTADFDPGLGTTGWGVIAADGNRLSHVDNGEISTDAKLPLANRLVAIDEKLRRLGAHIERVEL